jgi:protein involved in polysaccharide export with SLBB domain
VDREGYITLPSVGKIQVAGQDLSEVGAAIREAYVPTVLKDVSVHVEIDKVRETSVLLVGAVDVPRLVKLRRNERNLLHAIATTEELGVSEAASGRVTLRRIREPEEVTLDLRRPEDIQAALRMAPLEDGDIVELHADQANTIFVGGLVNFAYPQEYRRGTKITVLQAIAAARGLRTDLTPREATLIRRMPDERDVHVRLDLERLRTGKDPNILLAAGDILWIPDSLETRVQDFVNRNIFLRAGVSVNYSVSGVEFMNRQTTQTGGGVGGGDLQDSFDPFGFLTRGTTIQSISNQPTTP